MAKSRILMVCLGNICRSPTAEAVLRRIAAREFPDVDLEVDSAGTADYHIGAAPDERAQRAGHARGYELGTLCARQVERADFERFDLVLAMDESNLENLRRLAPPARRQRVRLLLDFAPQLARREVPDPYYGGAADFEEVLDLTEAAARGLLVAIRLAPGRTAAGIA